MALTKEQLLTFLRLPKFGNVKGFALSNYAISNDIVLDSDRDMLDFLMECRAKNISRGIPEYYLDDLKEASEAVRRIISFSEDQGIGLVTYFEKEFPAKLRGIRSKGKDVSPLLLWYKGDLKVAEMPGVAIIGTREPTKEGIKTGEYLGKKFAEAGINVISGLAYGCDKSGHVGALQAEDGKTTAFLAHGLDTVYPQEHTELAEEIVSRGGLLMSEYAIGTRGMANFFVERDRLQSGLADTCVVIQTGTKGGTLHAVRATVENKKPLYAVTFSDPSVMAQEKVQGNSMLIDLGIEPDKGMPKVKASALSSGNVEEVITELKARYSERKEPVSADSPKSEDGQYTLELE